METTYRTAYIYVREAFAGYLRETDSGYSFIYDAEYLKDPNATNVSITLPKCKQEYTSKTLFAFFDGLIPEGWLLNVVTRNWKLNPNDRFGILLAACRDSIGNVSIREVKE